MDEYLELVDVEKRPNPSVLVSDSLLRREQPHAQREHVVVVDRIPLLELIFVRREYLRGERMVGTTQDERVYRKTIQNIPVDSCSMS